MTGCVGTKSKGLGGALGALGSLRLVCLGPRAAAQPPHWDYHFNHLATLSAE
jgi:hypothetical protein